MSKKIMVAKFGEMFLEKYTTNQTDGSIMTIWLTSDILSTADVKSEDIADYRKFLDAGARIVEVDPWESDKTYSIEQELKEIQQPEVEKVQ